MPIKIIRDDITKVQCDAIVNAANKTLLGGGGVDGAIHKVAGIGLFFDCLKLRVCKIGEAKITPAHKLPCKYVIHTVGPKWKDGNHNEEEQLASCYTNSLLLAKENNCESVAFPLISTGVYKFPKEQALSIAIKTIKAFLVDNDMDVIVVVYDKSDFQIDIDMQDDVDKYISEHYLYNSVRIGLADYVDHRMGDTAELPSVHYYDPFDRKIESGKILPKESFPTPWGKPALGYKSRRKGRSYARRLRRKPDSQKRAQRIRSEHSCHINTDASIEIKQGNQEDLSKWFPSEPLERRRSGIEGCGQIRDISRLTIEEQFKNIDEGFRGTLFKMIDDRGMKDSECYKKANVDKRLFSKIRCDDNYHPSKTTALAFAVALELNLEDTKKFIATAGYTLTHSSKLDLIVEYYIIREEYDVDAINMMLFKYDQKLLGY